LVRRLLDVKADDCPVVVIRMRLTAGPDAQFFWGTKASPPFTEDKSVRFKVQPDGEFHDCRLDLGEHPGWKGHTITAIRVDPGSGANAAEFAIGSVRGEKKK
jgi:hypothetical protein